MSLSKPVVTGFGLPAYVQRVIDRRGLLRSLTGFGCVIVMPKKILLVVLLLFLVIFYRKANSSPPPPFL